MRFHLMRADTRLADFSGFVIKAHLQIRSHLLEAFITSNTCFTVATGEQMQTLSFWFHQAISVGMQQLQRVRAAQGTERLMPF